MPSTVNIMPTCHRPYDNMVQLDVLFPTIVAIEPFFRERGYTQNQLSAEWQL